MVLSSSLHALHTSKESSRVTNLGWWWWGRRGGGRDMETRMPRVRMYAEHSTEGSCYSQRHLRKIPSHFVIAHKPLIDIQILVYFYRFKKDNVFSPHARFPGIFAWQLKAHILIFQFWRSFWRPAQPKQKKINTAEI